MPFVDNLYCTILLYGMNSLGRLNCTDSQLLLLVGDVKRTESTAVAWSAPSAQVRGSFFPCFEIISFFFGDCAGSKVTILYLERDFQVKYFCIFQVF